LRVLVSGADGFLGANLCRLLQERGHVVTGAALNYFVQYGEHEAGDFWGIKARPMEGEKE